MSLTVWHAKINVQLGANEECLFYVDPVSMASPIAFGEA